MSVLIKGMKMPSGGNWITVRIYPDGTCAVPNRQGDCTILKGVNAAEIPPHGRLVDADKLADKVTAYCKTCTVENPLDECDRCFINDARVMVMTAPTVIESEGE